MSPIYIRIVVVHIEYLILKMNYHTVLTVLKQTQFGSLTNHRANSKTVIAVVVVLPTHVTIAEAQVVGALNITCAKRTTPIVAVTTYIAHATIVAVTSSREEYGLSVNLTAPLSSIHTFLGNSYLYPSKCHIQCYQLGLLMYHLSSHLGMYNFVL